MADVPVQVIPARLYLPQFGIDVPVVRVPGMGDYIPMRMLCRALGIAHQPQLQRLQVDDDLAVGVETFSIQTAGGEQQMVCLRRREVAWWLGSLDSRLVRKLEQRFNTTLAEFKRELMDAADRLWWGVAEVPPERALAVAEPSGAIYLHCRRCRARHRLELVPGAGVHWEIDE